VGKIRLELFGIVPSISEISFLRNTQNYL